MRPLLLLLCIPFLLLLACNSYEKENSQLRAEMKMLREENDYLKAEIVGLKKGIDQMRAKVGEERQNLQKVLEEERAQLQKKLQEEREWMQKKLQESQKKKNGAAAKEGTVPKETATTPKIQKETLPRNGRPPEKPPVR
jgi:hypothetical protein